MHAHDEDRQVLISTLAGGIAAVMMSAGFVGAQATATASEPPVSGDGAEALVWVEGVKNAYPRWSRDGARILYESNRSGLWQLHVMDADGTHDRTISDGQANDELPDWSPDNRRIAFVSDRGGDKDVYVMDADGRNVRNLTRNPALDIHPYWSPDGRWILFNSTRDADRLQLYEVRPDGSDVRRLARSGDDETCARVSPDGTHLVLLANLAAGQDDVLLRRRDGSRPVNLTDDPARDGWPTWTPDGARIVFASARDGSFALYAMRLDGGEVRRITRPPAGAADARPSVSPDGTRVLFNREVGETIGIFVVEAEEALSGAGGAHRQRRPETGAAPVPAPGAERGGRP